VKEKHKTKSASSRKVRSPRRKVMNAMRNELAVIAEDLKIHFRDTSARRISHEKQKG
jgi:hypothetical protein